jgi:hypothetical protein
MHRRPILTLIVGLSLWACGDPGGPGDPAGLADGTIAISTSTSGDDPDPDGFQLRIDGTDSLALLSSGTAELDLSPGRHTLQLVGVAEHCSVVPGTSVEVDITSGSTTPVAFQVSCPLTGARITVTTTGLDLDPDGYGVMADGRHRGTIASNGTVLTKLDPGSRTIGLAGLASNCAIEGSAAHTVTIVTAEVATIDFAVVCTSQQPLSGFLWGQVFGEDAALCLEGGMVEIVAGPGKGLKSGQPDTCDPWSYDGWFLNDLQLGATVTLRATAPGYQPKDSVVVVPAGGYPIQFVLQRDTGSRTIRLTIVSHVYPELTPWVPVQVTLDGKAHDIQVPLGGGTFYFGGLGRGMYSLAAQYRRYPTSEWIHCQRHPGWNGPPVSTVEADTADVRLELVSTVHCHFF